MSNHSNEIVRWYRVDGMRLVTPASVGASWMLELTDSTGVATEAVWIVDDLPRQTIPREGSWGLFRLACYDMGLALTANFVTALLATLAPY
ncbi:hypothetical protein [Marinobacter adhaerens]|jgi:hypothetical protein|nr:hypothetical protein [Marinobacter adhaerens]